MHSQSQERNETDKEHSALMTSVVEATTSNGLVSSTAEFKGYFKFIWFKRFRIPLGPFTLILSIAYVAALVTRGIFLPVYLNSIRLMHKSNTTTVEDRTDYYVSVLFFAISRFAVSVVFLLIAFIGNHREMSLGPPLRIRGLAAIGFINFFGFFLLSYCSSPTRTPPQLQVIMVTSIVPFGVLVYRAFFGKWVSSGRLVCAFVVVVGLVISLEPVIFKMPIAQDHACDDDNDLLPQESSNWKIVWCGVYVLTFLPRAMGIVVTEKEMKLRGLTNVHLLVFLTWVNFFFLMFAFAFVWIDLLPFPIGTAHGNGGTLGKVLQQGLACSFGTATGDYSNLLHRCKMASVWGWSTAISSYCVSVGLYGLTKFSANSVQTIIVSVIVTPLGTLFWMLFTICPRATSIHWYPAFKNEWESAIYVVVGMLFMVPAAVAYKFLGKKQLRKSS